MNWYNRNNHITLQTVLKAAVLGPTPSLPAAVMFIKKKKRLNTLYPAIRI